MRRDNRNMSGQEQARALDQFHDRFAYQKMPDWLRDEAKAKEKDDIYKLGYHTAELNKLGTLMLSEPGVCMTLSAEEAYNLLMWLDGKHRDTLYKLTHQHQTQEG